MDLKSTIPKFLKRKLLEHNLSLKELSSYTSPYKTLANIHLGLKSNPEIKTLVKVADFFRCSLDEVVGRNPKYFPNKNTDYCFNTLESEQINKNLKTFIILKSKERKITLSRLSLNIGFSSGLLADFIREDRSIKSLRTLSICNIADYFDVSIDQMIGRVHFTEDNSDSNRSNNN